MEDDELTGEIPGFLGELQAKSEPDIILDQIEEAAPPKPAETPAEPEQKTDDTVSELERLRTENARLSEEAARKEKGLLAEVTKLRADRRDLKEDKEQQPPQNPLTDPFTDPNNFMAEVKRQALEELRQERFSSSLQKAHLKDPDAMQEGSRVAQENPFLSQLIEDSDDPGSEILNIARVKKSFEETGKNDPEQFKKALEFVGTDQELTLKILRSDNPGKEVLRFYKRQNFVSEYDKAEDFEAFILAKAQEIQARQNPAGTPDQPSSSPENKPQEPEKPKIPAASLAGKASAPVPKITPPENVADFAFG